MRITSKQHAQILAWSLHAYGAFQAYYLLNLIWLIGKTGKQGNIELVSPSVFAAVAVLVISFAASASIYWGDRDPKVAGIFVRARGSRVVSSRNDLEWICLALFVRTLGWSILQTGRLGIG